MYLTPHVLIASAASKAISKHIKSKTVLYILAFLTAFILHFILDAIPHTDWGSWHGYVDNFPLWLIDYITLGLDLILSLVAFVWLTCIKKMDFWLILITFFGAALPDLIAVDFIPALHIKFREWPVFSQMFALSKLTHFRLSFDYYIWGIFTQLIVSIGGLWYLLKD